MANNKPTLPKPSADPAIVDSSGKAYSASQDADRTPTDGTPPPADLAPPAPVPQGIDRSRYSTDFGSPAGQVIERTSDKPTTLAEEKPLEFSDETPGAIIVQSTHGQSFSVRDESKGEAKKVRLGATFKVVREGQVAAICRVAGSFNANEGTFGWQHVNANLTTKAAGEFAGIQTGDRLEFLGKDSDLQTAGQNPFERAKGTVG